MTKAIVRSQLRSAEPNSDVLSASKANYPESFLHSRRAYRSALAREIFGRAGGTICRGRPMYRST